MAKSKIIKELANNEITMEVALNRLLIIASDIDNEELSEWASSELHGYKQSEVFPAYRQIKSTQFIYCGINGSFQVTNVPFTYLPILQEIVPDIINLQIGDSISTLQGFLDNSDSYSYCRDYSYLNDYVYGKTGIQCTRIIQCVPLNYLQNIMSEIKTRLLKVLIKLDKEFGSLDDLDVNTESKTPEEIERINSIVNNYIYVDNSVKIGDKNRIDNTNFR